MNGLLILDKPEGMTSFQAVRKVRGLTGEKKAGHCGTLDPMATGVLPILLGGATRFLEFLPDSGKCYEAELQLGVRTDTLDRTGKVLREQAVSCGREELEGVLPQFCGSILQVPPMYSARKQDGVRLYDLARKGIEVERAAREVQIESLRLLSGDEERGRYRIAVSCSKGTYIRTLIDDIGSALGCGAMMTELRRTATCGFSLDDAVPLSRLSAIAEEGQTENALLPLDSALQQYPAVTIYGGQPARFSNGGALFLDRIPAFRESRPEDGALYRVYDTSRCFLGLGKVGAASASLEVRRLYVRR